MDEKGLQRTQKQTLMKTQTWQNLDEKSFREHIDGIFTNGVSHPLLQQPCLVLNVTWLFFFPNKYIEVFPGLFFDF